MAKAARLGDIGSGHGCFPPTPIVSGSGNVVINGQPAARQNDSLAPHGCGKCPPHGRSISGGSGSVFINNQPAARVGDSISCGGSVTVGSGDVLIGDQFNPGASVSITEEFPSSSVQQVAHSHITYDELTKVIDSATGNVISDLPYFIECSDGSIYSGRTNIKGETERVTTSQEESLQVYWGDEALAKTETLS